MSSAASGAKEQVARLLTLVPYLHARGGVRLDEAARDLGVPARQLVKDLRVLFLCGLPGGYPDDLIDVDLDALVAPGGDRVIRVANADYLSRPLRLSTTEATALIVALRALRGGAVSEAAAEVVDRVLAKLERAVADGAAPVGLAVEVPAEPQEREQAARKALLQQALGSGRQVRIAYFVPSRDEESERVVDPRGLVTHAGNDYLDAYCHSAEAPRLFRLDRIREATMLDTPIATEPTGPRDLAEGLFAPGEDLTVATLRLAPEARWVTEYYPVLDVRSVDDGALEVDLQIADPRWLARLVLRLAPHATVLTPEGIATDVARAAREALGHYGARA